MFVRIIFRTPGGVYKKFQNVVMIFLRINIQKWDGHTRLPIKVETVKKI